MRTGTSNAPSTRPSPVMVDEIAPGLTASLLTIADEALPPRPGDTLWFADEVVPMVLAFLDAHGGHEDWAVVVLLCLAAARRGRSNVTVEDAARVLADVESELVERRVTRLFPIICAS